MSNPYIVIGKPGEENYLEIKFRDDDGNEIPLTISPNKKTLQLDSKVAYIQNINQERGTANFISNDEIAVSYNTDFHTPPKLTVTQTSGTAVGFTISAKSKTGFTLTLDTSQDASFDWIAVE